MKSHMNIPFPLLFCILFFLPFTAPHAAPSDHLLNAVECLKIAAGMASTYSQDVNGDDRTGLVEAIHELKSAAATDSEPVAEPTLRTTLPASWDENWFASPAVYDLDGDGRQEIVAGRHSVLYVWNDAGALLWRAPVGENATSPNNHGSNRQYTSPVVGDLDNDGKGEIAIAYANKAAVYDHNGLIQSGWPQSFPGSTGEIRSLAAADLTGDEKMEILAVKTSSGPVTVVWRIDGDVLDGWPQVVDCDECVDYGGYNQNIGAADIDGDGALEVISTYDSAYIGFMEADGRPMPAHSAFDRPYVNSTPMFHDIELAQQGWGSDGNDRDEFTDSPPVFGDLDEDGIAEVILYSDHERAGEYINRGNCLWVLNADMTRVPGFETPICSGEPLFTGYQDNIVQVCPAPALADLTGDSRPEIIVPSYDGFMRCYSPEGNLLWNYRFDVSGGDFVGASGPAAGDLNKDGVPEIIFSTYAIVDDISHLIILNADGNELHKTPLAKRGSMSVPTLADTDGDGSVEILVSLKDTLSGGLGGVQIYDVASAGTGNLPWPTGRGNRLRDGRPNL